MSSFTESVQTKFKKAICNYRMLDNADEVVVGFSGGADSVCLLHILNFYKSSYNYSIKAVHINHGIRGIEADSDEAFAGAFCEKLDIPFVSVKVNCIEEAKNNKETVEECGRRLRYVTFNSVCSENSVIATAHNANDNAETMLFNMTRGTSVKGLCGIPFVRDNIIRPLLYCSRKEIEGYCFENNLEFVTDSTNSDVEYTRNKIRHMVLPVLEQINPSFLDSFSSLSDNACDVVAFLNNGVNEISANAKMSDFCYRRDILINSDKAVVSQFLCREFDSFCNLTLDNKKVKALYELLSAGGRLQIYGDYFAEVKKEYFRFYKKNDNLNGECFCIEDLPFTCEICGYSIEMDKVSNNSKIVNQIGASDMLDCNKLSGKLVLRTRKAGDKFTFVKRNVTKSLKKLFTEENIPIELRDKIPVISDDDGVVWVLGFGTTKRCSVTSGSDNIILVRGKNNDR